MDGMKRVMGKEAPDMAGSYVKCPTCDWEFGPLHGYPQSSMRMECPCGNLIEIWPALPRD